VSKPKIISISIPEEALSTLNSLQKNLRLKGRSETIREAINALESKTRDLDNLKGDLNAIATIIHKEKYNKEISGIVHKHSKIIKTHIHNHLDNHKCAEVLVLKGKASEIKALINATQTNKKLEKTDLIIC